ncbi:MAG: BrnT family toxin [Deltaproteobacteria bacterium]|nr:BrnT family toxin [Deltaproteobacteria bacterium]
MSKARFEWNDNKDKENQEKHGVSFTVAQLAFLDPKRVIAEDLEHGGDEKRYFCIGDIGHGILTVRFTYRKSVIRIFGAGFWRKGKKTYEEESKIHE